MDAQLKAKWVEALRSGEYKQGQNQLKNKGAYCCLGVACVVLGLGIDENQDYALRPDGSWPGDSSYGALAEFGVDGPHRDWVINMNDSGATFPEIADYIEANIPASA